MDLTTFPLNNKCDDIPVALNFFPFCDFFLFFCHFLRTHSLLKLLMNSENLYALRNYLNGLVIVEIFYKGLNYQEFFFQWIKLLWFRDFVHKIVIRYTNIYI